MQDVIALQLIAADFKETIYLDTENCAICKAVKRQLKAGRVMEAGFCTWIDSTKIYEHSEYTGDKFNLDAKTAAQHNYDTTVIREIVLTKSK